MRLFFFILIAFFASCVGHISTKKSSIIPSTSQFDASKDAIIQNSLPEGGRYSDSTGRNFGIFSNRAINFPADSFTVLPSANSYLKSFYDNGAKKYIHSTSWGQGIIIQNSLPKGAGYTDPSGKRFGYTIFWTRVINETATPLELTISFPAAILPLPDSYLKVFLPQDTMTLDKVMLYDYGATGLKSFLDTNINDPTMLQRTINPNEECLFYIGALFDVGYGIVRAELVLKEHDLFYRINSIAPELDSVLIPCGKIVFAEQR